MRGDAAPASTCATKIDGLVTWNPDHTPEQEVKTVTWQPLGGQGVLATAEPH